MVNASDQGKIYEAWRKKTKREIGKAGEEEGDTSSTLYQNDKERSRFRHHKIKKEMTRDELKSADQIRKARKLKQRQKDKMMKRKRQPTTGRPLKKPRFH